MTETVDLGQLKSLLKKAAITDQEAFNIIGAGAAYVTTVQKVLCPVSTGATRASIQQHYKKDGAVFSVEVGPSTDYAVYIEYGLVSNPNYPIQPFVVPSGTGQAKETAIRVVNQATKATLLAKGVTGFG